MSKKNRSRDHSRRPPCCSCCHDEYKEKRKTLRREGACTCCGRTSRDLEKFVGEKFSLKINLRKLNDLPGLNGESLRLLDKFGYGSSKKLFGVYLLMRERREVFMRWLRIVTGKKMSDSECSLLIGFVQAWLMKNRIIARRFSVIDTKTEPPTSRLWTCY
ncbi:hypothetical protein SNEBB_008459 [Seison nebaliae]|nr:hypothetical protein SNEBB_008459 [Seison nebaliae]